MNETNEQEASQDDTRTESAAQPAPELPGRLLREHRESSHLSCEEVAHHLRLDVQLIKALEDDDYSRLPSPAYICGYLRSYARLLKLPEDEIVQAYSHGDQINAALIPSSVSIAPKKPVNTKLIKTVIIMIITALVAGGLYLVADKYDIFGEGRPHKSSKVTVPIAPVSSEQQTKEIATTPETNTQTPAETGPAVQQPSPAPVQAPTGKTVIEQLPTPKTTILEVAPSTTAAQAPTTKAPPEVTPAQQSTAPAQEPVLRLHFNGDSWAEVTDSTGKRLVYHLVEKNTDLNLSGEPPFTILLGNAPEVQVFYKGKEFDHTRYQRDQIAYFRVGVK
jgi:cytoskeleton protein RodZ